MSTKLLKTADDLYSIRFLVLLTTPWKNTKAFKFGIIDDKGNKLKDPQSPEEIKAYTTFHKLVFNLKKLIEKVPFGKSSIAKYATALYMLKEETSVDLTEDFLDYIEEPLVEKYILENSKYIKMFGNAFIKKDNELILEDGCFTSGMDISSPPLFKKKLFKRQRINKEMQ